MYRHLTAILFIVGTCGHPASGQLVLRLSINFSEFASGTSFQTTPYPLANSDNCIVTGSQPVQGRMVQCGEVDTAPTFGFRAGGQYTASVSATDFSNGQHTLRWFPTVACVRVGNSGETIAGGNGSFCRQTVPAVGDGIFWDIGGRITIPETAAGGSYTAMVTLTVTGSGLQTSITVPATLRVSTPQTTCRLRTQGAVNLGTALAQQAGSITVTPVTGLRTYGGSQEDPTGSSSFSMGGATVTTNARQVTVSVQAPSVLRTVSGTVGYQHYTAYKATPGNPFVQAITGSGARVLATSGGKPMVFRFGGRVTTVASSTAGVYRGTTQISFQCN